MEKKNTGKI
jgi:hypothetical protein